MFHMFHYLAQPGGFSSKFGDVAYVLENGVKSANRISSTCTQWILLPLPFVSTKRDLVMSVGLAHKSAITNWFRQNVCNRIVAQRTQSVRRIPPPPTPETGGGGRRKGDPQYQKTTDWVSDSKCIRCKVICLDWCYVKCHKTCSFRMTRIAIR